MLLFHAVHNRRAVHLLGVLLSPLRPGDGHLCADAGVEMLRGHADEEEKRHQQEQHRNQDCAEDVHAGAEEIPDAAADKPAALHSGAGPEQLTHRQVAFGLLQCAQAAGMNECGKQDLQNRYRYGFFHQPVAVQQPTPHHGEVAQQEREQEPAAAEQPEKGKADAVADRADRMGCRRFGILSRHQVQKHADKQEHGKRQQEAGHYAVYRACGGRFPEVDRLLLALLSAPGARCVFRAGIAGAVLATGPVVPVAAPLPRLPVAGGVTGGRACLPTVSGTGAAVVLLRGAVPSAGVRRRVAVIRGILIEARRVVVFVIVVLHETLPFSIILGNRLTHGPEKSVRYYYYNMNPPRLQGFPGKISKNRATYAKKADRQRRHKRKEGLHPRPALDVHPPPEGLGAVACSRLRKTVLFPDARTLATGRVSDMPP